MKILTRCPECGAEIQPSDTVCMSCGADLIQAELQKKKTLQEDSVAARRAAEVSGGGSVGGALAGQADASETSEETRLRIFDKQEAERLVHERLSCYVTAGLVVLPALALLVFGLSQLRAVGLAEVQTLSFADLRTWDAFGDQRIIALVAAGLGLAGCLSSIGLIQRALRAGRAIRDVERGQKPLIVSLVTSTYWGLMLTALFCPPLGVIVGIALRFSSDEDIRGAAHTMIIVSLVVIAVVVVNALLALTEGLKSAATQ